MLTFCLGVGPDVDDRLVYLCLVNAVLAIPDAKRESDGTRGSESRPFDPDFFHFDSLRIRCASPSWYRRIFCNCIRLSQA